MLSTWYVQYSNHGAEMVKKKILLLRPCEGINIEGACI